MKNFDEIYEELQGENNNELNDLWKELKNKIKKANKISLLVCLIMDILAVIIFLETKVNSIFSKMPLLMIVIVIDLVLAINLCVYVIVKIIFSGKETIKYHQKYKSVVINKLMNNFYDNLEYFPNKEMPKYIYEKLQYEHYDNYKSEDYFEGYIDDKYSIQMAEVLTQDIDKYEDSEGKTHTRTITKFHGLFAKVLMEKSIKSELQIMQNGTFIFNKKLEMDSSEFEKHFDVKASDKIVGMQLLTADVMEELVQFANKTKMKFDIYIKGNELYLRYHSGEMFEPGNIKNNALDKENIRKNFYMLNFTYNLSKKLINVVNETHI